jgi:thiol:disulfide interchange protein DsbD
MASALGFTLSASAVEALAVFVAIGLGMALPYLLLGWFPGWLRWLPKPGRWMESLRQALAFPMFITAAWLAWVLGQQAGIDAVLALAVGAIMIAFGAWCLGRFVQPRGVARARLATLLAIASLAGGLWLALSKADPVISGESSVRSSSVATSSVATSSVAASSGALGLRGGAPQSTGVDATASTAAWQTWSPQRVTEALAAGRPVFVDFTAAWCVSCQANKKLVLDRDGIVKAMADRGVLRLRADWTQRDPAITAELARHGRSGVPLYLLFEPASRAPRVLPELLTTGMVLEAMAAIPTRRLACRSPDKGLNSRRFGATPGVLRAWLNGKQGVGACQPANLCCPRNGKQSSDPATDRRWTTQPLDSMCACKRTPILGRRCTG